MRPISVRRQLSFKLTIVANSRRKHIQLTSSFHCSIAHSVGYFETKIQVCNVSRTPVRPQNVHGVDHQLSDTDMNYQIVVYFCSTNYQTDPKLCGTASYTLNGSFKYFCRMYIKLCQVSLVILVVLSFSVVKLLWYGHLYCRIQAKIIKAKAYLCLKMALWLV